MNRHELYQLLHRLRARLGRANRLAHRTTWDEIAGRIEPTLEPGAVVVDVGSGHAPVPRADVLVDLFPGETIHRKEPIVVDRPLVVCSVERLPFVARAFDFAVCNHVLEHVPRPGAAVSELGRIARAGYIETPAFGKDILVGTGGMHRWQVVEFEGTLHFFEYSQRQAEGQAVPSPIMDLLSRPDHHPFQDYYWGRQDLFNACAQWRGQPPSVVEHRRRPGPPRSEWRAVEARSIADETPCQLTTREVELLAGRLATPDGGRPMRFDGGRFVDDAGGAVYPVRGKRIYCELES